MVQLWELLDLWRKAKEKNLLKKADGHKKQVTQLIQRLREKIPFQGRILTSTEKGFFAGEIRYLSVIDSPDKNCSIKFIIVNGKKHEKSILLDELIDICPQDFFVSNLN